MNTFPVTGYARTAYFIPMLKEHGLSRSWLYKIRHELELRSLTCGDFLPVDIMTMKLATASKSSPHIFRILERGWTMLTAKRMTNLISTSSQGKWAHYFGAYRDRSRILIRDVTDLYALRPRYQFFMELQERLRGTLHDTEYRSLLDVLHDVSRKVKICLQASAQDPQTVMQIMQKNALALFYHMADTILYGKSPEDALLDSLRSCPNDTVDSPNEDLHMEQIELAADESVNVEQEATFNTFLDKQTRELEKKLLLLRLAGPTLGSDPEQEVQLDIAIFRLAVQGFGDADIVRSLKLPVTRQALALRRKRIMLEAQSLFAELLT